MATATYNPRLHALALLTAAAMFPLIFMGGLVTSHGAGMSVPDWPNSYGYNMFRFPISMWVGGIWYEHIHRLMGTVVGMLGIALTAYAWWSKERAWVRWLATSVLGAIIVQGVLGGLRVVLIRLGLAVIHGCFAQAVFCLAGLMVVVTSRWWLESPDLSSSSHRSSGRTLIRLATIAVTVIYLQLIVGAFMRHHQAGLAIPDVPMVFGKWLPPMNATQLEAANRWRENVPIRRITPGYIDLSLWQPVSMAQIWIHFAHRIGAICVTVAVGLLVGYTLIRHRHRGLLVPAVALIGLLIAQVTLGVLTVLLQKPADIASTHVAVGALTLLTTFVLLTRASRLYRGHAIGDDDRAMASLDQPFQATGGLVA